MRMHFRRLIGVGLLGLASGIAVAGDAGRVRVRQFELADHGGGDYDFGIVRDASGRLSKIAHLRDGGFALGFVRAGGPCGGGSASARRAATRALPWKRRKARAHPSRTGARRDPAIGRFTAGTRNARPGNRGLAGVFKPAVAPSGAPARCAPRPRGVIRSCFETRGSAAPARSNRKTRRCCPRHPSRSVQCGRHPAGPPAPRC